MTPAFTDEWVTVYNGDVRAVLRDLPADSVHCVVTSPPYWGLRDYGTAKWEGGDPDCAHRRLSYSRERSTPGGRGGSMPMSEHPYGTVCGKCGARRIDSQIGLEPTPELYVEHMVDVFREVRRVLRSDGTCWLNLGDTYASHDPGGYRDGEYLNPDGRPPAKGQARNRAGTYRPDGIKPKDLVGIPWRVAFALQADGWYLRADVIWSKPNPMPESVSDRPTKAHEYVFMLSKSRRYYYDAEAIREPIKASSLDRIEYGFTDRYAQATDAAGYRGAFGGSGVWGGRTSPDSAKNAARPQGDRQRRIVERIKAARAAGGDHDNPFGNGGRNKRSVWTIATQPYPGAHFATFPEKLVEPCIQAGTSEHGVCPDCGAPWRRLVERSDVGHHCRPGCVHIPLESAEGWKDCGGYDPPAVQTLGWTPSCVCGSELQEGDLDVVDSPEDLDAERDPDPTLEVGRAGFSRPRAENEGRRTIYRYQQRRYAEQLRASEHRAEMAAEAGSAFKHYVRTDRTGARPVPERLLESWIERGWLEPVPSPMDTYTPPAPLPAFVLDPFAGSGTTLYVARRLGRRGVGVELNPEYLSLIEKRLMQGVLL